MRTLFGLYIIFFLSQFSGYSQDTVEKYAAKAYKNNNFTEAIKFYEDLLESDPVNREFLFKIGVSYLSSNVDKSKAIKYLEKLYEIDPENHELWYYVALAYHYNFQIDRSLEMFEMYKPYAKEKRKIQVEQRIKNCKSAKVLMRQRVNVTFENLGPLINTKYPDYYPFVSKDDEYLTFTSRRINTTGGYQYFDGFFASDIMMTAKDTAGNFEKARKGGSRLNTKHDDQCVGLSDDGRTMFIYTNENKDGNIYKSYRKINSFGEPEKLGDHVNTKKLESAACISHDESLLFFSSKMDGGYGGLDLYMTRKLPSGEWALPQNLGPNINTEFNEDFPTHSIDDQILYFCSEGHENIGGFDIFSAEWNPNNNKWSIPKNIGYPINTPDDERVISFTEDGHHAYISAVKKGGEGDLDIYRITLHDNLPQAIVKLNLINETGEECTGGLVSMYDQYDDIVGKYNTNTGSYLLIVPVGKFYLHIAADGMKYHVEEFNLTIADVEANPMMVKEIILKKTN
jgi:hypothetical protein